jgi:beta-glucosidase
MTRNLSELGPEAPTLTQDGFSFRDLNKNGRLDPYEDSRRPIDERVEDLLSQMTLEEKAGMMFHTMIGMNEDGSLLEEIGGVNPHRTSDLVARRLLNHFNVYEVADPRHMAEWYNRLQKLAERTRLGIPVTISSDPRHAFTQNPATSMMAGKFSKWPEPIGLAATGDPALVEEFGDIARQEYVAVGIRTALHPMADMATEPRWARINGTFGEDAALASQMVSAYIKGFQGDELGPESVACMTKHFPGGGPQKDGEDAHFSYGREQVYPGGNFDYHLIPFEAALEAGTTQIMPYYGMPVGLPIEEVGFGFNKDVITGLSRQESHRRGCGPVWRRSLSRGHRRPGPERPDRRSQNRRIYPPAAQGQVQIWAVRQSVRGPGGSGKDRRQRRIPKGRGYRPAEIGRTAKEHRNPRWDDPTDTG